MTLPTIPLPLLLTGERLAVYTVWWTVLVLVGVVFLPLAVVQLQRVYRNVREIERAAARSLAAVQSITDGTATIHELTATVAGTDKLVGLTGNVRERSEAMAELFHRRAGRDRMP
jgi:urea transporter